MKKKNYFTTETYRRLARNPFVDEKSLDFIRKKIALHSSGSAGETPREKKNSCADGRSRSALREETARFLAAAIRQFLKE